MVTLYVCMYSSSSSATRALSENYHRHLQTRTPSFQGCVRWITYQTRVIFCWNIWKNLALKGQINFKQTHLPSIIMFWESFSYKSNQCSPALVSVVIETELVIGAHLFQRALLPGAEEEIHVKTLPKAQGARGLSSYHKVTVHKSWTYNNFRISI